jgi:hypothetical protein
VPTKTCSVCHVPKDLDDDFYNSRTSKDGKASRCKQCDGKKRKKHHEDNLEQEKKTDDAYHERNKERIAARMAAYGAKWYAENKEKKNAQSEAWRLTHPEECNQYAREWRKNNPDKSAEYGQRYYSRNKSLIAKRRRDNIQRIRDYKKRRAENDPEFKLYNLLSNRMRSAINRSTGSKSHTTFILIGCTPAFLRTYLESQFKRGMSWENYGSSWEIDHIIPCDKWNLLDPEEQLRCFHFSNLQPLTRKKNRQKAAAITDGQTKLLL